jgi:MtN3 and saliva related transmembrane protein
MHLNIDHLGFAAAACTTGAFVPQVVLVWRARAAPGISTGMYLIFIVGIVLWLGYGIAIASGPMIVANCLTLVLASAVLGMKWYFERARPVDAVTGGALP